MSKADHPVEVSELVAAHREHFERLADSDLPIAVYAERGLALLEEDEEEN